MFLDMSTPVWDFLLVPQVCLPLSGICLKFFRIILSGLWRLLNFSYATSLTWVVSQRRPQMSFLILVTTLIWLLEEWTEPLSSTPIFFFISHFFFFFNLGNPHSMEKIQDNKELHMCKWLREWRRSNVERKRLYEIRWNIL